MDIYQVRYQIGGGAAVYNTFAKSEEHAKELLLKAYPTAKVESSRKAIPCP